MQINYPLTPMVQSFISKNMPHGGYNIISSRLRKLLTDVNSVRIRAEISFVRPKSEPNYLILKEACKFIEESNIELDKYCLEYLELIKKESLNPLSK